MPVFSFLEPKMPGWPTKPKPLRTRIYIDGYNLYYGCLKGTPYKWLDPLILFDRHILPSILTIGAEEQPLTAALLPNPSIKYFTAKIVERVARTADSVSSQARYHTALEKTHDGRIQRIDGYYAVNEMTVKIVDTENPKLPPRACQEILAWKVEEKQSDVSLALHAYHDALTNTVDQVVIVTNDTDLVPALRMIRNFTDVIVGLVIPTTDHQRHPNADLKQLSHWVRSHITQAELAASQLPRVIHGARRPTTKPESWYAYPDILKQILDLAIPIRGSKADVFKWMEKTTPHLGDRRPIELIETEEGAHQVLNYIRAWQKSQK